MLIFIGIGYSKSQLTVEAINEIKRADKIYIDTYTSLYEDPIEELLEEINPSAEYIYATRRDLEGESISKIIREAESKNIAIISPGDPFIATTHDAIRIEAIKKGIKVKVIHGISVINMIQSRLGLQAYRFGKIVTLVYPDYFKPYSTIEIIYENLSRNLHSIVLLDLRIEESKIMSINEAVEIIKKLDQKGFLLKQPAIGVARISWKDEKICADILENLTKYKYPPPPHTLVIIAPLYPIEREFYEYWKSMCFYAESD